MFQSRVAAPRSLAGFDAARGFFADYFARTDPARETLFVAYLDGESDCVHLSRHDGDVTGVDWPLRSILLEAARRDCAGLIVAHNHPSGDATPSPADRTATRRLATAGEAIDLTLVDHLVFAGDECTSFRRMGLL
jgi:DNA repair protein RadC